MNLQKCKMICNCKSNYQNVNLFTIVNSSPVNQCTFENVFTFVNQFKHFYIFFTNKNHQKVPQWPESTELVFFKNKHQEQNVNQVTKNVAQITEMLIYLQKCISIYKVVNEFTELQMNLQRCKSI